MKADIHPNYERTTVRLLVRQHLHDPVAPRPASIHVELCNECHPFFTGKQKLVDSGGRVERFQRRYGQRKGAPTAHVTPDPQRRSALLGLKLGALVRDAAGEAPVVLGSFGGGAGAGQRRRQAWVLADERPERALGPALAWARQQGAGHVNVIVDEPAAAGVLARRADLLHDRRRSCGSPRAGRLRRRRRRRSARATAARRRRAARL